MNKPNASISVILALLMIATPLAAMPFVAGETGAPVQTPMFTGGDGSIGDPYWIVNVSDLQNMSLELDAHYKLVNDIDASNTSVAGHWVNNGGAGFLPVGTIALQFTGNLEGNGFTITNLFINRPGPDYIGLFGAITGANGNIKNVTLAKVNITGNDYTGALVGWSDALGAIENCHVEGTVLGDNDVGGMMGYNQNGPVTYCSADVDVTMDSGGGGLIAWNDQATITSCFATGDVTGLVNSYGYGGLVGYNQDSVITKCYATGDVSAAYRVGGLVGTHGGGAGDIISQSYATGNVTGTQEQIGGFVGWNNWAYIENCYSTGAVNGNIYVGGFAGHNREAHITNCYSTGLVTGNVGVGGFCGWDGTMFNVITSCYYDNQTSGQITSQNSTGHTTTDMLNNFTYTDAGWDFDNVWFSVNGSTRPFLQMEHDTTIKNSHQLQLMQMNLTADYTLANDIDLSDITNPASMWGTSLVGGEGFYSIGTSTDRFHGSLDGQGHIIADLFINRPSTDYIGLFGYMEFAGTTLTNIGLINNNVTGSYYVGGLVAHSIGGPVTNCYTTGTSTAINNWVGGLVGRNDAPLTNCYATGNVSGAGSVGGLTGYNYYGEILNCYATGDISGTGDDVGGLIGDNRNIVSNCYATGNVIGNDYVGGLTGYASAGSGIDISNINNCSSFGNVDGHSYVAGITGWTDVNTMFNDTHSFGTVTGSSYLGGLVGRAAGGSGIISNSTASGNIIGTSFYVGGLVGMSYHDIRDSIASGDVSGSSSTGGLVGRSDGALIDCTAYGNATGTGDRIGGLVGDANAGSIMDCIAHGNVEGANRIGGLIGQNSRPVAGSEAYGNVTADRSDNVGGLIGYNTGTVDDCRADSYVMNDGNNTGGLIGYNNGPVSNSTSFGDVYNPRTIDFDIESTGGLIGEMAGSTVSFCEAYGNVTGNEIYTGGLIGYIAIGATVTNSSAYGITNASGIYIGGLVGMNEGTIIHCSAHGVTGDAGNVKPWTGGLVGRNYINGLIQNSSAFGDVFGSSITGGLVGENRGIIERSYSTGDVIATSNRVGGFVGWNIGFSFGDITDCYSQGNATGGNNDEIGGFVGNNTSGSSIINVYSTGLVTGSINGGGLVGTNWISTVTDSHWDIDTSGQSTSAGGEGNDDMEMMQQATFTSWDFTDVWGIYELQDYPMFQPVIPMTFSADLGLTVETSSFVQEGDSVVCYVNVTNNGPDNAVNINATLTGSGADVIYEGNNQTADTILWQGGLSWNITFLAAGETAWMQINLTSNGSGIFTLDGTVTSDIPDSVAGNNVATANVETNAAPNAVNDTETLDEDSGASTIYVLENDTDTESDDIIIDSITQPSNGTVIIIEAGKNLTYEPDADWFGDDFFNYTIRDDRGGIATAMVNITVQNVDDASIAVDDAYNVIEDSGATTFDVLANDHDLEGDAITISTATSPAHGSIAIAADGLSIDYTPDADFSGTDSFTYNVSSGISPATVTIDVTPVNDAPIITTTDITAATEDILYSVDYNATDIENDTLTWSLETAAGWLNIDSSTGILSGTPTNDDVGTFSVSVKVNDGNGGTDWSNFTLIISNTNDAPIITTANVLDAQGGQPYIVDYNATDIDGDTLSWSLSSNASWMVISPLTGELTGAPGNASGGTYWVNVTVDDGNGGLDWSNFTLTVTGTETTEPTDTDGDGTPDDQDDFPNDANETTDTDGDGTGDNADAFPDDPDEDTDTDGDGIGNNADEDDDNDGIPDEEDDNPLVKDDKPSNNGLYIILILVIVGAIAGYMLMRGKGKEPAAPVEESVPETTESEELA